MLLPTKNAESFLNGLDSRRAAASVMNEGGPTGGSTFDTIAGTATGAVQSLSGAVGPMLPPAANQAFSIAQPLLTSGLSAAISGSISPGSVLSGGMVAGLAGQFLPPQAAQALSLAQGLISGGPLGILPGLVSRFLPPELQAVFSAAMHTGMIQSAVASVMPPTADGGPERLDIPSEAGPTGSMAPFAARVGDAHVCPMFDGPKPHVGGPILPPGCPTVLIGGPPAARIGDMATCAGPPDTIVQGEPTVLIGSSPAARMGDSTAHGGKIVIGCPTVVIGKSSAGQKGCTSYGAATAKGGIVPAPGGL